MIFSSRIRTIALSAVALSAAGLGLASAPAMAQDGPYYVAKLSQPATESRTVAGGIAWVCRDTMCVANKGNSRPARICRGLSREFGDIAEFTANGKKLSEEKMARCNGK